MSGVRHLYVHLPFCAHRCGYCDFVTVVGKRAEHAAYVDALIAELALEGAVLADRLDTIFLGGGTPTFTEPRELARLLAALPEADELTVEANPETVTPELARLLRESGVNRVSLGAQSFRPHLLEVLERRARPDDVRRAVYLLRDAGFDNISLDLLYGIPGQSAADLEPISPTPSPSSRSISPATSSRRSRARVSPIRTGTSSSGRPRRWRATSRRSSRR